MNTGIYTCIHISTFYLRLLWYIYQSSHARTQPTRSYSGRPVPSETRTVAQTGSIPHGIAILGHRPAPRTRISQIPFRPQLSAALDRRRSSERNTPERHLFLRRQAVSLGIFLRQ